MKLQKHLYKIKLVNIFGFNITREKDKKDKNSNALELLKMVKEVGVTRDAVIGDYQTEENPDDLDINTYLKMQETDGTVQAITRIMSLPIQSAQTFIEAHKDDNGEADFIRTNLFGSESEGGMSTPIELVIADMTRAIVEGFRVYNKVPKIIEDGKYKGLVGWRKLAPRDARTIQIKVDNTGGFDGVHQMATYGDRTIDIDIPKGQCMLYTFQKEKHWLYGESILKTPYYHYLKKHKLYYISLKKAEVEAMGIKVINLPASADSAVRAKLESAVDNIGVNTRISKPYGYDIDIKFPSNSGADWILKQIDHHDLQMTKSALSSMMDLNSGGSYALSKDKSAWLIMGLNGIMRSIEATINSYVISPLINYNFKGFAYPKFRFTDLSNDAENMLNEITKSIFGKPELIPRQILSGVLDKAVEKMGIEVEEIDPKKATEELEVIEKVSDKKEEKKETTVNNVDLADKKKYWRELTKNEKKVSFDDIEDILDIRESEATDKIEDIFNKQKTQLKSAVKKAIQSGSVKPIKELKLKGQDELESIIEKEMSETFEFAKRKAADDDKNKSPKTSQASEKEISKTAKEFADIHEQSVKDSAIEAVEKAFKEKEIKLADKKEEKKKKEEEIEEFDIDDFVETIVDKNKAVSPSVAITIISTALTDAVNKGRDEYFQSVKENTYGYEYSALLDNKTCFRCMSLDGRVIEAGSSDYVNFMSPQHNSCRCIWVRIDKQSDDKPKITGIPSSISSEFNDIPKYPTLMKSQKPARLEVERRIRQLKKKVKVYEKNDNYYNRQVSFKKQISRLEGVLK